MQPVSREADLAQLAEHLALLADRRHDDPAPLQVLEDVAHLERPRPRHHDPGTGELARARGSRDAAVTSPLRPGGTRTEVSTVSLCMV